MDYINFSPVNTNPANFEAPTGATASAPKTLLHVHTDITYVSTGGAWTPLCQESSGSVYSGYTSLSATAKTSVMNTLTAASTTQPKKSTNIATIVVRGR